MNRRAIIGMMIPMLMNAAPISAGTLQIGAPTVEDRRVTFPIMLEGDVAGGVSALDFRFNYDAVMFEPVSVMAGPVALEADKRVEWNVRTPGECIVVMMGMNQSLCQSGELAHVVLQRVSESGQGECRFAITRPTLSSYEGKVIAARGSSETMAFSSLAQELPQRDETNDEATGEPTATTETAAQSEERVKPPREDIEMNEGAGVVRNVLRRRPAVEASFERAGKDKDIEARPADPDVIPARPLGHVDRERLAAVDRMRDALPTPAIAAKEPSPPHEVPGTGKPPEPLPANGGEGRQAASDGGLIGAADAARNSVSAIENDRRADSRAVQASRSEEAQTPSRAPVRWGLVAIASLLVLAGLLIVRKRLFT